jgi:hypothetical protein
VYDHDPGDVDRLGWEEFGLGCSPDLADRLVRDEIINGRDWQLGATDAGSVLAGMARALAAVRDGLAGLGRSGELSPDKTAALLDQHALLAAAVGVTDVSPGR